MRIRTRRVYAPPGRGEGRRILIELRRWYRHEPARWDEFRRRYFAELDANPEGMAELRANLGRGTVTLLFGSKEERLNNAAALREYLEAGPQRSPGSPPGV